MYMHVSGRSGGGGGGEGAGTSTSRYCGDVVVARNAGGPYLVSTNCYKGRGSVV